MVRAHKSLRNVGILLASALFFLVVIVQVKGQLITRTKWPSPQEKIPSYTLTPKEGGKDSVIVWRAPKDDEHLGQVREVEVYETEHHLYKVPFRYKNVTVDHGLEYNDKRIEILADVGTITIVEEKPIVAVTIVGSGCCSPNYNTLEWWGEGESISKTYGQLVKRSRIDNLKGIHNAWLQQAFTEKREFKTAEEANKYLGQIREVVYGMTSGYYMPGSIMPGLCENTAYFRIGDVDMFKRLPGPYKMKAVAHYDVHRIVVRAGGMDYENPGCERERYPADYAIRLIDVVVKKRLSNQATPGSLKNDERYGILINTSKLR